MDWKPLIRERLAGARLAPAHEAEIVDEIAQHLDERYRERRSAGATEAEAINVALHELDGHERLVSELARAPRAAILDVPPAESRSPFTALSALWTDAKHASRSLRQTPGFVAMAVVTLALAIGPTTAIVSVANWLLWRPPPGIAEPERLAEVWFGEWRGPTSVSPSGVSTPNLQDLRAASKTLSGIAGVQEGSISLSAGSSSPGYVGSSWVTANFFDVLRVQFAAGRGFSEGDGSATPVAVIGDGLSRRMFGTPEAAIGREVRLNGVPVSIVGVSMPEFRGISPMSRVDVWVPWSTYLHVHRLGSVSDSMRSEGIFYSFVIRLAPQATFDHAQAELDVLAAALAERHPEENRRFTVVRARVFPGLGPSVLTRAGYTRQVDQLVGVGIILLLLGCANCANLFLFRAVRQRHLFAIRQALGAARLRLMQLALVQVLIVAVAGGLLGMLLAMSFKELVQDLLLPQSAAITGRISVPLDSRVLSVTLLASLVCALLSGLAPAWVLSRGHSDPSSMPIRTLTHTARLRTVFASVQLALSLMLVVGALLMGGTLRNLRSVNVGFDHADVATASVDLMSHGYTFERMRAFYAELLTRLATEPAFQHVALARRAPFGPRHSVNVRHPDGQMRRVQMNSVSIEYFQLLGIPVRHGRPFTEEDASVPGALRPAIVSESLARTLFATTDAVGRTFELAGESPAMSGTLGVVGVVGDVRWRNLTGDVDPLLYVPFAHDPIAHSSPTLLIRTRTASPRVSQIVQAHAAALDPVVPLSDAELLSARIDRSIAEQRALAWVCSLLGALGFVLAAMGLFGLVSQTVSERTREFGIRLALGAGGRHVAMLVLRYAAVIFAIGGFAGLMAAVAGSRYIESRLFGVQAVEPRLYVVALLAMAVVVMIATAWPARAATRVDPVSSLRDF